MAERYALRIENWKLPEDSPTRPTWLPHGVLEGKVFGTFGRAEITEAITVLKIMTEAKHAATTARDASGRQEDRGGPVPIQEDREDAALSPGYWRGPTPIQKDYESPALVQEQMSDEFADEGPGMFGLDTPKDNPPT
ncbi:hypothetical protein SBOR_7314 [Sclerotinia borealis F-4128]|uniref:Uncharacterized protein n=1 Tax=Sclerotinia borealis (strain F-4128) TaxID=1432307 RepID=W9C965_SCLBF|nr:hypothetical protein SBOR_7314 [Sclerotinia borealis F-4128]